MLVTGSLWGRPTWGACWVWDARLTSTALLVVLLPRLPGPAPGAGRPGRPGPAGRPSLGLLIVVDVPVINWSVDWWRTLHQDATLSILDAKIDGLMLFTLLPGHRRRRRRHGWLLVHRFRLAWLEEAGRGAAPGRALAERRAEAEVAS